MAGFTFTAIGSSGLWWATRRTAPERVARALSVAGPFSSEHQETCSRMFAIWKRYGLRPAFEQARRKVFSWRWGEHAATTTRSSFSSLMSFSIISWPSEEHMNL